jgi:hypothetical protein
MWRVYLLAALIAGASAAITAYIMVKFTVPEPPASNPPPPPLLTQKLTGGEHLEFQTGDVPSEKLIYYKVPFASSPHLTLTRGSDAGYKITDKTEKSFKLQRGPCPVTGKEMDWRIATCTWEAEGLPAK